MVVVGWNEIRASLESVGEFNAAVNSQVVLRSA